MSGGVLGLGLLACSLAVSISYQRVAEVRRSEVAFGDVADVSRLPAALRDRAAALPIVQVPASGHLVLTSGRLTERARALMPALAPFLPMGTQEKIVVRRAGNAPPPVLAGPTPRDACMRVVQPVAEGSVLTRADLEPVGCEANAQPSAVRYDPEVRALRAERELEAGETLAAAPVFALAGVRAGQRLYVRAQVGPVVVEREVEAVQPGRTSGKVFVRASDGVVFSAPFSDVAP